MHQHYREDVAEYFSPYFRTETWKLTLSDVVHPIPSMLLWPQFEDDDLLQIPLAKRQPGRPKKHRNRAAGEGRPVTTWAFNVTCRICGARGHNRRGCPDNPCKGKTQLPKKRKTAHAAEGNSQAQQTPRTTQMVTSQSNYI